MRSVPTASRPSLFRANRQMYKQTVAGLSAEIPGLSSWSSNQLRAGTVAPDIGGIDRSASRSSRMCGSAARPERAF